MRKVLLLGVVFLLFSGLFGWAQEDVDDAFSVAFWVSVEGNNQYERRIANALVDSLEQSRDFQFVMTTDAMEADIHVVIRLIRIPNSHGYAAAVSYTPMFAPWFTNADAATVGDSMSDMTWLAEQSAQFVVDQLFVLYDTVREENTSIEADSSA